MKDVDSLGFLGIFTGGIKATAAGVCAAVFFSLIAALITRAHAKN
jgi:stage V sporulation protein AE